MSFRIDNFQDTTKWKEVLAGSGSVIEKTVDSFKANCVAENDVAGLVTVNPQDLTVADFSVFADRKTARTILLIREDQELTNPLSVATGRYLYAFIRDSVYGIQIFEGYGYLLSTSDPVPPGAPAEMRIVISDGVVNFYYNGELILSHTPPGWAAFNFSALYVYVATLATRDGTTVTGTTTFSTILAPPSLTINVSPSSVSLQIGQQQTFVATAEGGTAPYTLEWIDNTSGAVIETGDAIVYTATELGTFEIYAKVTDNAGDVATSSIVTITVIPPQPPPIGREALKSEIRGVFVHAMSTINPNWDLIAQTVKDYGLNMLILETGANCARYDSDVVPHCGGSPPNSLTPAINACHARDMRIYVSMNVMMGAYGGDGKDRRAVMSDPDGSNLRSIPWLCPTKQASRDLLKALVEELVTRYDIDGFMFDYARYFTRESCFCPECEAKFKADTGLTDAVFPTDVIEAGKYSKQFVEWRITPINDLVRDMRSWMLAIKPDLEFTAAVWRWPTGYPTYWRYWLGQDATFWVKQGWLDWVAPMAYVDSPTSLEAIVNEFNKYQIAGPEGIIPLVPFLDTCVDAVSTPENFAERVAKLRSIGADGWVIWRYGGPGDGEGSDAPDIRDYLGLLQPFTVFSIKDLYISPTKNSCGLAWNTDIPTTAKVEINTSPLANAKLPQ